jgi:hypothetical protein
MTKRITLRYDTFMPVDGQWQIVLGGSTVDVPDTMNFAPETTLPLPSGISPTPATLSQPTHAHGVTIRFK